MAVLMSKATGNFTAAGTWGIVDSTSYLNAETGSEVLTTAYSGTRSSAFTPGAIEIDGIAVKLSVRTSASGTISVSLNDFTAGLDDFVSGTEVTIANADLAAATTADANGGWIFFKFAAPVTLLASPNQYKVQAKTSGTSQVSLFRDGTADNIARCLRTTTTQAPTTGDDLIVCGEYTAPDTSAFVTVTMNNTATTDFGSPTTSTVTPALAVCALGTLAYGVAVATNYYLKLSGHAIVYASGTMTIGTLGAEIPRDSTAVLEFDVTGADGDIGLIARNLALLRIFGLSRTSGKNVVKCKLNTDEAAAQTVLGVDTDTGWLSGDVVGIASTTRTPGECESRTLSGNATATEITVSAGLTNAHSGTSPTQAEVILLTRNVIVRSASATLMAYVYFTATADARGEWCAFYNLGENVASKRGIEIATTTGICNFQYCSIYDCEDWGLYQVGSTANNVTFSNNVMWNCNSAAAASTAAFFCAATSGTVLTYSGNVFMWCASPASAGAVQFQDVGGTITNNTIAGCTQGGLQYTENSGTLGTCSGQVVHSCGGIGVTTTFAMVGTFATHTIWRNGGIGLTLGGLDQELGVWTDLVAFGNATANVRPTSTSFVSFKSPVLNSDVSFTTPLGLDGSSGSGGTIYVFDGSLGATSNHTTADLGISPTSSGILHMHLFNTTLASATETTTPSSGGPYGSFARSHKTDGSATTFWQKSSRGTIASTDVDAEQHTATGFAWKMTPAHATRKLVLPGPTVFDTFKAAVNASTLVTIKAWIKKDGAYNGAEPRLVLVGGIVGGIASDVVATYSGGTIYQELTVTGTPNEAGVVEWYVDCAGTAGNAFVDDMTVSQA